MTSSSVFFNLRALIKRFCLQLTLGKKINEIGITKVRISHLFAVWLLSIQVGRQISLPGKYLIIMRFFCYRQKYLWMKILNLACRNVRVVLMENFFPQRISLTKCTVPFLRHYCLQWILRCGKNPPKGEVSSCNVQLCDNLCLVGHIHNCAHFS